MVTPVGGAVTAGVVVATGVTAEVVDGVVAAGVIAEVVCVTVTVAAGAPPAVTAIFWPSVVTTTFPSRSVR